MSKIGKVVKGVPKNWLASHENLLRSSGWLAGQSATGSTETAMDSSSRTRCTTSLNYLAMQHYFRMGTGVDLRSDSVTQSVCQFWKQDAAGTAPPSSSSPAKVASRGMAPVRREPTTWSALGQYRKLLFDDVNLSQYLSTVQAPRKSSTGLRPGRVIVQHYPHKTSVHVLSPDVADSATWKRVASALSAQSKSSVVVKAVRLQSVYQSASLVAQDICLQLEQRKQFRGITQNLFKMLKRVPYVEGIRVICSGRINGALIARTDRRGFGPLTLQSFSSQVDYAQAQAQLPYGILGIKVWVSYV